MNSLIHISFWPKKLTFEKKIPMKDIKKLFCIVLIFFVKNGPCDKCAGWNTTTVILLSSMSFSGFYLLLKLLDDWWDFEDALDRFFWSFFPIFCKSKTKSFLKSTVFFLMAHYLKFGLVWQVGKFRDHEFLVICLKIQMNI